MNHKMVSRTRGCLLGGAVGDALGYPVEFFSRDDILKKYGENGITAYKPDKTSGLALISDDTQMTLFTANGLLVYDAVYTRKGFASRPLSYILKAYRDWYACQMREEVPKGNTSWLSNLSQMHERRAPGLTCLSALGSGRAGSVDEPENNSKGCGGVMRVSPVALYYRNIWPVYETDRLAAESAALTHGHPLGYISAAAFSHIISEAVFGAEEKSFEALAFDCADAAQEEFKDTPFGSQMKELLLKAVQLSKNDCADYENISALGEGWTGEEALAISVYCCLRHQNDFDGAVIAAVNHSGDSDSTGAITGNLMGAYLGEEAIGEKWRTGLELYNEILEIADDLSSAYHGQTYSKKGDAKWKSKYFEHKRWSPGDS